ncbi:hypothetical protein FM113_07365 [Leucobacter sp. 7(1)]|nr:hypothetical protein FM113_07365 [Leucobacter sp. 7(1)]
MSHVPLLSRRVSVGSVRGRSCAASGHHHTEVRLPSKREGERHAGVQENTWVGYT